MTREPRLWSAKTLTAEESLPYAQRFARYVAQGAEDECWMWLGALNQQGYGRARVGYGTAGMRGVVAPRLAWVLHNRRDLAADLSIDHLCRTPRCVNPHHLEPVNIHENQRRRKSREAPDAVESRVQELLLVAPLGGGRHPRGQIRRLCPICDQSYATDYLADHIRRHVIAGEKYRPRRVAPRDGSAGWNRDLCPDCGVILSGHLRRHRVRMHGAAA